ncbi:hypothetical protein FRB99_004240 [Tulasnella sp. 403]|nr:hypothetical protein FRB99_004240 [Tulasnella sp. 403]
MAPLAYRRDICYDNQAIVLLGEQRASGYTPPQIVVPRHVRRHLSNLASFFRPSTATQRPANAPPSSYTRRAQSSHGPSLNSAEKSGRRASRVDMDFEQALKAGGTVVLEEGRRLESLGHTSTLSPNASSSRSSRPPVTAYNFRPPATPTVVPPTPTHDTGRNGKMEQSQKSSRARDPSAGSSILTEMSGATPSASSFDEMDDIELHTKRRSLFRSPGTSSSPDLATLVRKTKERGGVAAGESSTSSTTNANSTSGPRLDVSHPEASSSAQNLRLSPVLSPGQTQSHERYRSRTRSSTSSSFSLVSSPSVAEDRTSVTARPRNRMTKAEKILGVSGHAMGTTGISNAQWNVSSERVNKTMGIKNKTSALWTKMTGSTRRPSSSRDVPTTPTSAISSFSFYSQGGPFGSSVDVSPPPVPPLPSSYRPRPSTARDDAYISPLDTRPSTSNLSKPLPPIYKSYSTLAKSQEAERAEASSKPPKSQNMASRAHTGRRRSMSVDDALDLQQVLSLVGRVSQDAKRTTEKVHPALPRDAKVDKADGGMFGGWSLVSPDEPKNPRVSPNSVTFLSEPNSTVKALPQRPRAQSDAVALDPALQLSPSSSRTPGGSPMSLDSDLRSPVLLPSSMTDSDGHLSSDQTEMASARSSPQLSSTSTEGLPLGRKRSPSQPVSPSSSAALRKQHYASLAVSPDRGLRPEGGSHSEPSLSSEHASASRRVSEDVTSSRHGGLQVSIDKPPHGQRTVRLLSAPAGRTQPDPSTSSLEVSVYDYAGDTTVTSSSPIRSASSNGEDVPSRAKGLAEKCWKDDESFLPREKIAEWLGGTGVVNKLAVTHYMENFDFKRMRLDNAFRHLCAKLYLKGETQQVDRILESFAQRYWDCNPSSLFGSASVVHSVAYSLLLLNTDLHIAELTSHMSRPQFVRNTLGVINDQVRPSSPTASRPSPYHSARASTPDLPTQAEGTDLPRQSGELSDAPSTLKMRSKRSGSISSWKSGSREALGVILGNMSTPTLASPTAPGQNGASTGDLDPPRSASQKSVPPSTSIVYGRAWEHDMETLLKEMYNAVKAQQILQPTTPGAERPSVSLTPGSAVIGRSRSQRSYSGAALKRGSIRGIQSLLGSQSPYSSNSSSTDGRVSPSPSFATSAGEAVSTSTSSLFTPTLGFASNLSHTIIKEAQEDDGRSVKSANSVETSISMTDEELALFGPPWAKEGLLCRKHYWEGPGKRAKDKNWMDVFVVIQKGELSMFTFGEGKKTSGKSSGVGGGNWLANAQEMGKVTLAHSVSHSLPPPGYNRSRPHCFVVTLSNDEVYFFQAGTEDLVNEWVSTCNYWAARVSKEPLSGGVSNMEYGWSRVEQPHQAPLEKVDSETFNDAMSMRSGLSRLSKKSWSDNIGQSSRGTYSPHAMEKIFINDWKPPMPSTVHSTHDEETQLEALYKQVRLLKTEMAKHNEMQVPMQRLYQFRSPNFNKAMDNWEARSRHLLAEIYKYDTYVECLRSAMNLRLTKQGEKAMEKTLVTTAEEEAFAGTPRPPLAIDANPLPPNRAPGDAPDPAISYILIYYNPLHTFPL